MNISIVKSFFFVIITLLMQVMVLNNLHLFSYATPFMIVYIIMSMPNTTPRWLALIVGFVLGIVSDTFSNTPGMAAIPMTLIAFIQPPLVRKIINEENGEVWPSLQTLGFGKYLGYTLLLVLLFCVVFYSLEQFNLFSFSQCLLYILGSTLITIVLILAVESLRKG